MKNINFLPDYYRQRNELRQARLWWGICTAVFGSVIALTAVTQWGLKRGVQQQLALVEPLFQAANNHDQKFVELQKQVVQQGETAALYVYLQHPWRRSQILAAVVQHLPPGITLAALDLKLEAKPQGTTETTTSTRKRHAPADTGEAAAAAKKQSPEQRDLAKLRGEYDSLQTIVEIRGTTADDAQLHAYVAQLSEHPLLAAVRLQSIESLADNQRQPKSSFVVRLQLKPGYGQPNGPEVAEPTAIKNKPKSLPTGEQAHQAPAAITTRVAQATHDAPAGDQP